MAKTKRPKYVSPIGTALYPRLHKPDTQYKAEGEYSCKLRIDGEEAERFIEKLESIYTPYYKTACKNSGKKIKQADKPWTEATNDDGEEIPGAFIFTFKLKAKVSPKDGETFEQRPAIFDASKKLIKVSVGGGSKLRIAGDVNLWVAPIGCGLSLWLKQVQVIDLVEYVPGGASCEFDAYEDGFVANEDAPADSFDNEESYEDSDEGDF